MFSGSEAGDYMDEELPSDRAIGRVTSSAKGHTLGKMLAMAYVKTSHAWPGSRLLVAINGRPVRATVTATPFFDPQGIRLRAKSTRRTTSVLREA
jgi:glycine cleavage system aminomethyltransferase T